MFDSNWMERLSAHIQFPIAMVLTWKKIFLGNILIHCRDNDMEAKRAKYKKNHSYILLFMQCPECRCVEVFNVPSLASTWTELCVPGPEVGEYQLLQQHHGPEHGGQHVQAHHLFRKQGHTNKLSRSPLTNPNHHTTSHLKFMAKLSENGTGFVVCVVSLSATYQLLHIGLWLSQTWGLAASSQSPLRAKASSGCGWLAG